MTVVQTLNVENMSNPYEKQPDIQLLKEKLERFANQNHFYEDEYTNGFRRGKTVLATQLLKEFWNE